MRAAAQPKPDGIVLRAMTQAHLDGALALSGQAGWAHGSSDWSLVLGLGQGVVALDEDRIVGTGILTPYGPDHVRMSMIIVDAAMRGRGLGRRIVEALLIKAGKRCCQLVATSDGRPLYERLGFAASGDVEKYDGVAQWDAGAPVTTVQRGDLPALAEIDRAATGTDRSALLDRLFDRGWIGKMPDGYVAIRRFGAGMVIGPLVARSDSAAELLLSAALARITGNHTRIDLPQDAPDALRGLLLRAGLRRKGGGLAMIRPGTIQPEPGHSGAGQTGADAARIYALASQALG